MAGFRVLNSDLDRVPTPREALEYYRQRVPPNVAENAAGLKALSLDEKIELLFYMSAGLSETLAHIIEYHLDDCSMTGHTPDEVN